MGRRFFRRRARLYTTICGYLRTTPEKLVEIIKMVPPVNLQVRRVKVSFKHNDPEHNWVYERLGDVISSLNSEYYQFDLTGFAEPVQLGNYSSKDQGTYNLARRFWKRACP